MGKLRLALLAGGRSGEREISLMSGETVFRALDKRKYQVTRYDPRDDLVALIEDKDKIDLALILLHGKFGEDGRIQGFLDLLGIPFVGSGVLTSAVALNKSVTKTLYQRAGLKVIEDVMVFRDRPFSVDDIVKSLGPLSVVKPVAEGSSLGMTVCRSKEDLHRGIELAFRYDEEVMIERHVEGVEVTCCVLGTVNCETLPLVEIVPNPEFSFFDYHAKYTRGATREICPARLSAAQTEMAFDGALRAHRALRCRHWSRTDMIVQGETLYILETNTIPGMTENSLVPLAARTAGMSLSQLVDRLIELSLQ
jgi:D-alanine-D-alanine ligase